MLRRTKIVSTLGPASESREALTKLIAAGVDVVRMNFSHGEPEEHINRAKLVREIAEEQGRNVAILGDLQGPKIRIARFKEGKVNLVPGEFFTLDAELDIHEGTAQSVGIAYKSLPNDCKPGDVLLLDDGRLSLEVDSIDGPQIRCKVLTGGILSNNKGINLQGGGLSAPALTEKDKNDIKTAAKIGIDYMAVSFVRCKEDLDEARALLEAAGGRAAILSKIERAEVVNDLSKLEEVIDASDAIMVARGDLGVEIGDAELVGVQKEMINMARRLNRPVITATQMMESMIENSLPTRAEVFDVANAVLDGTDAVMLSAETATGHCPHGVVEAMSRIAKAAEKQPSAVVSHHRMDMTFERTDETIAMSAMYAANHQEGVKAIVCLSKSGQTALWMSRINSALPIVALSRREETRRRLALYRGVHCLPFDISSDDPEVEAKALELVVETVGLKAGDKVLMTRGTSQGSTNVLKILTV
ncbi:pyruvate kinase [Sansalvadorimonas sp. 2012CJ34-2]|uniref:Pyruvate kinase n=1 Tax=Parendozoicomonas callyspongiae TaxID=2942213 RepID=A0ABT0PN37_9GAMM|nr:pyruvate kinase [Sansalvadorimonas sp. 2012CJ34-2]MCL6271888.1 pyruvate kinase [Sansalvadorimonas sp. 2012CJ34-2]